MTQPHTLRRHSPNRTRAIGRTVLWSVATVAIFIKLSLPVFGA